MRPFVPLVPRPLAAWLLMAVLVVGAPARSDAPAFPFSEGDTLGFDAVDRLAPWLPAELMDSRRFFFGDGMKMEIGPARRDYGPASVYRMASERFAGRAQIGPAGSLEDYVAGQPFAPSKIDCARDKQAGGKHAWNFVHRWDGFGTTGRYRFAYLDTEGKMTMAYEGMSWVFELKHRTEPRFDASQGDVFAGELRARVIAFDVARPIPAKGTRTLTYRYEASYGPPVGAKPEDSWTWAPKAKRVRRISQVERDKAVGGSDFDFDDLHSFSGLPTRYEWECVEERAVLAPMNTKKLGYPYPADDSGPSGFSYASDRWELRDAIHVRMRPKYPEDHRYARKELWLDRQTYEPIYSFAYDREDRLWKVTVHNHRWSEDDLGQVQARTWYPSWEAVPEPRDLRSVSEVTVDVQSGTGIRWDFWDAHGAPPQPRELMRLIDLNSLKPSRWRPAL